MILDQYGNPVSSASRHFANAADRSDRGTPPQPLFKDDFDKLIPNLDRQFLVSGSRKAFQNFGPISGAIIQKADNVVGRAWAPKFLGEDKEWGKKAAAWLTDQWYGNCDVRGRAWDFKTLLWLDSVAVDRDGDFLIVLTEGESGYPLTQRIPVNRIGQRFSVDIVPKGKPYEGSKCSHGVIRNKQNRPIAFMVLGDTEVEDTVISADRCIHVFDPLWHDQVRGIPAFAGAIKLIYGSLTATAREQMNQLARSSIALIEYNESGGPDIENPTVMLGGGGNPGGSVATAPVYETLAEGMIKYFRSNSGGKVEALNNDMPGDSWDRFQDRIVRTALSGINWPYELVWKADINAALIRNVQERARLSVEDRQDVLLNPAVFQIRYAIAKAIKIGILEKPKNLSDWWKWGFQMPRKFSVDLAKDSKERRENWKLGLISRADIAAEDGKDAEQIEDEKIDEAFRLEKKIREREVKEGITIDRRTIQMLTSNEAATAEPTDKPERDPDEETEEEQEDK